MTCIDNILKERCLILVHVHHERRPNCGCSFLFVHDAHAEDTLGFRNTV